MPTIPAALVSPYNTPSDLRRAPADASPHAAAMAAAATTPSSLRRTPSAAHTTPTALAYGAGGLALAAASPVAGTPVRAADAVVPTPASCGGGGTYDLSRLQLRVDMVEGANRTLLKRMDALSALHEAELQRVKDECAARVEEERARSTALEAELEAAHKARRDDADLGRRTGPATRQMFARMQELEREVEELRGRLTQACQMSPRVRKAFPA